MSKTFTGYTTPRKEINPIALAARRMTRAQYEAAKAATIKARAARDAAPDAERAARQEEYATAYLAERAAFEAHTAQGLIPTTR